MAHSHSPLRLLSDVQLLNDSTVTLDVNLLKITEKISSVTDHFKKTTAAVMVLVVFLKMLIQAVDSVRKNSDLNLGRTCVALMCLIGLDYGLLFFLQHVFFHLSFLFAKNTVIGG